MKLSVIFFLLSMGFFVSAQDYHHISPPKTYWKSYGFQKQPDHAKIAYYKSDSLGYEPVMAEVYSFNKDGHIIQKYTRIYGKFASETAKNYVYKNGVLDSINTKASAENFNSSQKMHYDTKGNLIKITSVGKYSEFTDSFTYDDGGLIQTMTRRNATGSKTFLEFVHKNNYIKETTTEKSGRIIESCYMYEDDDIFASFTISKKQRITFYDKIQRIEYELEAIENPFEYAMKMRTAYQKNNKALAGTFQKTTSKVAFEIPAEARNEQGDWIKRIQFDRRFGSQKRMVFQYLKYADGTESGSTEYDLIFDMKVKHYK